MWVGGWVGVEKVRGRGVHVGVVVGGGLERYWIRRAYVWAGGGAGEGTGYGRACVWVWVWVCVGGGADAGEG